MVTPGGTSKWATSVKSRPRARSTRTSSRTSVAVSVVTAHRGQLVDGVERDDGDAGEHDDQAGGGALLVRLDHVVDGERGGLGLAGDVAGDHERDAEVAERAGDGEHDAGDEPAGGEQGAEEGDLEREDQRVPVGHGAMLLRGGGARLARQEEAEALHDGAALGRVDEGGEGARAFLPGAVAAAGDERLIDGRVQRV